MHSKTIRFSLVRRRGNGFCRARVRTARVASLGWKDVGFNLAGVREVFGQLIGNGDAKMG